MKTSALTALLLAGLGSALSATVASGADDSALSPLLRARIHSTLPPFAPAATLRAAAVRAAPPTVFHRPNLVFSPPATARAEILRRMAEESLYERGAFDHELVKRELTRFDRCFLNRFTLPLVGVSREQRAREAYRERLARHFDDEVNAFARVLQSSDPTAAAGLRASLRQWQ